MLISQNEVYTVEIPETIIPLTDNRRTTVKIKPLLVHTFQTILKASRDDHALVPLLIIKESVVEPEMNINQVRSMKVGLVNFLIGEIKKISGITD
jgi:hypothetical protein